MQQSPVIKQVQVTTVVNQKNIDELEDLYQLLLENGVQYWRVVNCDPIGRANDNSNILLKKKDFIRLFNFIIEKQKEGKMKEVSYGCSHYLGVNLEKVLRKWYFFCATGINVGSVLSNGDIFVCPNVPRRPELIQGNVRTDDFVANIQAPGTLLRFNEPYRKHGIPRRVRWFENGIMETE